MPKNHVIPVLLFFLLASVLINPLPVNSITIKQPVIILDLPGLELSEISSDYPHLLKLVSTGSTALVTVPNSSMINGPKSFTLSILRGILQKSSLNTDITNKKGINTASNPVTVMKLDDIIPFHVMRSNLSQNNSLIPFKNKANINSILNHYRLEQFQNEIMVFTWVENYRYFLKSPEDAFRHRILRYYDYLTGCILDRIDLNNTLFLVCTYRPQQKPDMKNKNLVAVVLKGRDFTDGIIYSPSTRKQGIITCADLRDTILNVHDKTGPNMQIKRIPGKWRTVTVEQMELKKNYSVRWPLLTVFGYLMIGIVLALLLGFSCRFPRPIITMLVWIYLYLLTIPGAFLIEALISPITWLSIVVYTLAITAVIFLLSYRLAGKSIAQTLKWLAYFTMGLIIIDALLNGRYESKSFLGYSLLAGGRYYGIGNEYMGILMGAYIVGVSLSLPDLRKWRREILWGATLFLSLLLFYPYCGSDVGGGITALMGLGITNYLWLKQPIHFKDLARLYLLTLFILIFMAFLDFYAYGSSLSHLGKLLLAILRNGFGVFIYLAARKITMNLRLISSTPLTVILIGALIVIPFLYRYPPAPIKRLMEKYPEIISGFVGLSITAFIGLVTNDSGIVSAAMAFLFGIGLVLLVILKERFNSD
jgi:hypothetical protein